MPTVSHMPHDLGKRSTGNVTHSFTHFTLSASLGVLCPIFAPLWVHLCPCDQNRAPHIGQNGSHRVEKGRSSAKELTLVQFSFTVQKIQLCAGGEGLRRRDSTRESFYGPEPMCGEGRSGPAAAGDPAGGAFPARAPSTGPGARAPGRGARAPGRGRAYATGPRTVKNLWFMLTCERSRSTSVRSVRRFFEDSPIRKRGLRHRIMPRVPGASSAPPASFPHHHALTDTPHHPLTGTGICVSPILKPGSGDGAAQ